MKHHLFILTVVSLSLVLWAGIAMAEGFGTPIVDGVLDGVYGAAEASDPSGDGNGNAPMDLLNLYVCNDNVYWYFYFTINTDISANNWGKYAIYIDTTNDANGATSDAWGRNVIVNDPHKPEYGIYTWINATPYGTEDINLASWNGAGWDFSTISEGALLGGVTPGAIEWKVEKTAIGSPTEIWCEVWDTGGGGGDNAQDTINDPPDDWNATDWSTQAVLSNSTHVSESAGGDVIPPTVSYAKAVGQDPITQISVLFSEPVDQTTAETTNNYTVSGGITVNTATLQGGATTVLLDITPALTTGACYSVTVINVEDLAGNPIVANGVGNVDCFKLFELFVKANMNLHLRDHTYYPDPDLVAIEGSRDPFTWDPTCDDMLEDADGDSVYTGTFQFCIACDCGTGLIPFSTLEYKFTHQCTEWEGTGNHYYEFSDAAPVDTVNIWWEDVAPADLTLNAMDVIWFVDFNQLAEPPVDGVDTVGVNGSQAPLSWDVPPINELRDNGVLPDTTAGDGIWSTRITFPAGTYKNVGYKFLLNSVYECEGEGNRDIYLDDTMFSEANPLVMPVLIYDICQPSSVEDLSLGTSRLSLTVHPNPAVGMRTKLSFIAPESGHGRIAVYDLGGRLIRTLRDQVFEAGIHTTLFDGRDAAGNEIPAGIYFVRLNLNNLQETRRMTFLR
ncbi:MAG: Ig-like domain-containing protein [Candidatus Eisenbacteria bacterium]|nr:Ig-like domain-containing protein [Candidatus Eisenbacteria bacterium]MBU1950444.1 Ig-like domain-containing protein [Candidatus Eisenbacteria bacterium]